MRLLSFRPFRAARATAQPEKTARPRSNHKKNARENAGIFFRSPI
jgi:hypothetical protein